MISLEQVLLLQKKVETAIEKITALQGEISRLRSDNDALRGKCEELSHALDAKTELVSSLETNQGKIEEGILNALSRLDTVENSLLNSEGGAASQAEPERALPATEPQEGQAAPSAQPEPAPQPQQEEIPFRYEIVPDDEPVEEEDAQEDGNAASEQKDDANSLNGQFDIF